MPCFHRAILDFVDYSLHKIILPFLNRFVHTLPRREGDLLIRRCFFAERLDEIAARYHMTPNAVSVSLSRTRKKLAAYLKKEGFYG